MNVQAINAPAPVAVVAPVSPVARPAEAAKTTTTGSEAEQGLTRRKTGAGERGMEQALDVINEALRPLEIALKFRRDEESGITVVEMVDEGTGETLRQFPSEAMLHLSSTLGKLQGVIFDRQV